MRIAVLGYTGDRGNWGCQSTSRKMLRFIRETFVHCSPEICTVPLPRTHPVDRLHAAAYGAHIERILLNPAPRRADLIFLESLVLERHGRFTQAVQDADLVVFQAEGSLGSARLLRNAQLLLLPVVAKSLWQKPVLTLNQTLHVNEEADETLLAAIYRRFDLNAVREPLSLAFARKVGLTDMLLCPDFALAPDEPSEQSSIAQVAPGYFCVTGSASLEHYDASAFADSVRGVAQSTGLRPVFLHSRIRDDYPRARFFSDAESLGPVQLPSYLHMVKVLKGAAFTLGGRYHTAIAGLVHGVPALVLPGNNPKGEGLARMVPSGARVFLPGDGDAMAQFACELVDQGEVLRSRIRGDIANIQGVQRRFGLLVRSIFASDSSGEIPPSMADFAPQSEPYSLDRAAARLYAMTNEARFETGHLRARLALAWRRLMPGSAQSIERTFIDLP